VQRAGERPSAEALIRELGAGPRLIVFLGYAPGAGKTRRLLTEARALQQRGVRVAIGWIETKGRADLEALAAGIPRISPRTAEVSGVPFEEFDYAAALQAHPSVLVLDELAHTNLPGSVHAKRWQDALALRDAGIGVIGAVNVQHLEHAAPLAESLLGLPVREIVPLSFVQAIDQLIAIDVSPEVLEQRVRAGAVVRPDDVERALLGPFRPQVLRQFREIMLRTVDAMHPPAVGIETASVARVAPGPGAEAAPLVRRAAALAAAMDLQLEILATSAGGDEAAESLALEVGGRLVPPRGAIVDERSVLVALPVGDRAMRLCGEPARCDLYVLDPRRGTETTPPPTTGVYAERRPWSQLATGYGHLTIYLGAAAGCGKTYAMLDRAHQLKNAGVDVVVGFVETHGRAETAALLDGLELLPRRVVESDGVRYEELDRIAVIKRKPQVALVDELAHTNPPGSPIAKRYDEVLSIVRDGISVITTLNVQHLEGLNETVRRLTGVAVRETLPDAILELADELVLIDASPETLRERLRAGKIYPPERVERALTSFFTTENLTALRELALRETLRTKVSPRQQIYFRRLVLGVAPRERDIGLIRHCATLAARMHCELTVYHAARTLRDAQAPVVEALHQAARRVRAAWVVEVAEDPVQGLLHLGRADGETTLVVEGARTKRRWFNRQPIAAQLLAAGARDLLVLAPETPASAPAV